jgi:cytochrome c556
MSQLDALELNGGGSAVYISNKRIDLRMKSAAKTAEIDRLQSIGEVAAGPRPEDVERLKQAVEALARMNVTASTVTAIVDELVTIAGAVLYRPKG